MFVVAAKYIIRKISTLLLRGWVAQGIGRFDILKSLKIITEIYRVKSISYALKIYTLR